MYSINNGINYTLHPITNDLEFLAICVVISQAKCVALNEKTLIWSKSPFFTI